MSYEGNTICRILYKLKLGFVMEYFKRYDDIIGFTLDVMLITSNYQKRNWTL